MHITVARAYNKSEKKICGRQPVNQKQPRTLQVQAVSKGGQGGSQKSLGSLETEGMPSDSGPKSGKQKNTRGKHVFAIDSQISGADGRGGIRSRPLKPWVDEGGDPSLGVTLKLEDDPEFNKKWDQFESNKNLFGIKPSVGFEDQYTAPINRSAHDFKEREAEAARIAREIEGEGTNNPILLEDRFMDINADNYADDSCYAACEGVESAPKPKINAKRRPSLRLKEFEKPNTQAKSPGSPAQCEGDAKQIPLSHSKPARKYLHNEKKDQYKSGTASSTQKKHKSKQQPGERPKGPVDKPKEESRVFKNSRSSRSPKIQKMHLHAITSPTEIAKTGEKDQNISVTPVDDCSETQDPKPTASPTFHPVEPPAIHPDPDSPPQEDSGVPAQTRDAHVPDSPEYSAPGLNVYAEEFTPSSGYTLYTSQTQQPSPAAAEIQTPYYSAQEAPKYCIPPADYRYGRLYSSSETSIYQLRPECYHPQPYHSADDVSKYRLQQQYYSYPVAICPYNFIPMTRMISSSADSRVRPVSYTQRADSQEDPTGAIHS